VKELITVLVAADDGVRHPTLGHSGDVDYARARRREIAIAEADELIEGIVYAGVDARSFHYDFIAVFVSV
jgi:hypothetical protein